eukprot:CCRYP_007315-RA/>CCRYP_007315-RA protein AED:0.45 eAED:0.45 QI:0/-1/0/1/-1/1/1/0/71
METRTEEYDHENDLRGHAESRCEGSRCGLRVHCSRLPFSIYDKLQSYMQTFFQLTFATIRNDERGVALQTS